MGDRNILLIEDDATLGATLSENLDLEGYSVVWIKDGNEGLLAAQKEIHDLIVLDLMLPGKNGLQILESIRKTHNTPVLIISAKNSPEDRIKGLALQADDYLDKPFHLKEFLLRIHNLIKRSLSSIPEITKISIGRAEFQFSSLEVLVDGKIEHMSDTEAKLLRLLVAKSNTVVSRDEILDQVWGYGKYPSSRTIDNFIVKFRKWIETNPTHPEIIISQRGIGYMLKSGGH